MQQKQTWNVLLNVNIYNDEMFKLVSLFLFFFLNESYIGILLIKFTKSIRHHNSLMQLKMLFTFDSN